MTHAYLLAYSGPKPTNDHKKAAGDQSDPDTDLLESMEELEKKSKEQPSHANVLQAITTIS